MSVDIDEEEIRVLQIDDDEQILELTALQLERIDERITVMPETEAGRALERLDEEGDRIDCIVSDYNMPELNGLKLLRQVKEEYPDLPFILFTGRGSEEVAAEAITAGVTDYLQKKPGTEQYQVLANRITNSVERSRAVKEVEATNEFYGRILEQSFDYVFIVGEAGDIKYISPSVERVMGYEPEELLGQNSFEYLHPDDRQQAFEALAEVMQKPDEEVTVEYRTKHADGSWRWIEVRGGNFLEDPYIEGVMVNVRDITKRKKHEQRLKRQTKRLKELTSFMSHDMKNQLSIVDGHLDLLAEEVDDDHLDIARTAVSRIDEMIDDIGQLARGDTAELDLSSISIADIAEDTWTAMDVGDATLSIEVAGEIEADPSKFRRMLENLMRNALDHGGEGVSVEIGRCEDGIYVEDDGPGIAEEHRDELFTAGFSTTDEGTGFGLSIVREIVQAHGWEISVTDGAEGGARFEITGMEMDAT